ncbi:MAG TPA: SUMF1/EgtB/PvdO family nonheme iron enzyme [Kofleriaceae bacterium]|nr:SUMF1/EgtB/PvdO family nonheme iron enzyme [Kofleriaceae bacterium]
MSRSIEGAALLVAGHGAIGGTPLDASAVHTLGQIGEALLATGTPWQIRRLSAAVGERYGADRGSIKHHLDELVELPVRAALIVLLGVIDETAEPALVTSSALRAYPEDATLPLAWIGERLRAARAEQLLVVLSGRGRAPRAWLGALATGRASHAIAVHAPGAGAPVVDALLAALCGDALDPRTGTITMRSASECLARRVPDAELQGSTAPHTIASVPPLGGLWDVRRSQLSLSRAPRTPDAPDDLTGSVLPGRFRLDAVIARGTFGTVYRARQLAVERDVAVKVLHADIDAASEDGRLFVQEIRAVGRIDHPNVVRIHQADMTHDGRLFYAMELLDGRDLQQVAGALDRARAIELVRQLLAGLGAAHAAGLVHADVKPANAIVVARDGGERVVLVDFGLARLRMPDRPAESAGGTPAYMAPEQLHDGRVDARSDLFSAALVLVHLLTGWRRPDALSLVPPLDAIADRGLRTVLGRALALEPAQRYQTAAELAAALTGTAPPTPLPITQPTARVPFRLFAPLTESDRGRLYGREGDIAALVEHVLYRRSVVYTAPSGTGKTSLLRAGLVPRLEALGAHVAYARCRGGGLAELCAAVWPGASSLDDAIAAHARERGGKLVVVADQLEAALGEPGDAVAELLGFQRWPADADVAVVLSIREDFLARLVARAQQLEPNLAVVRLPPLSPAGARAAIVGPLAEARLAIEPELEAALLADLRRAAAALAPEMGWGDAAAVYPPHLQLACSCLFEALGSGEATLTLAHYKRLGGFAAIVGEHLERVLDVELAGGRDVIARDVLVALVTGTHERAVRPEPELLAIVGAHHGRERIAGVLEVLRARGLIVRVRGEREASWELVHDSLVPRVLAWLERRDLARRRAVELVRYHLRRSRVDAPSLLGRGELRELRAHAGAIAELDAEWRGRGDGGGWTPTRLVARSRQALRRRALGYGGLVAAMLAVAIVAVVRNQLDRARARAEQSLRDRDLGAFALELQPFDWDAAALRATPVPASSLPGLAWQLYYPDAADPDAPGAAYADRHLVRGARTLGATLIDQVEARGGRAFLVIDGRGRAGERCPPAIVPIAQVPGYIQRAAARTLHVAVPTCAASRAGTLAIARGPFLYGGAGEPASAVAAQYPQLAEREVDLPAYAIDRTEVTNAAFRAFADLWNVTGIAMPPLPSTDELEGATLPDRPIVAVTWQEARAYCRFLGKRLPTSEQWQKALRGGRELDGHPNPQPRRNLPWGAPIEPLPANVGSQKIAAVGANPLDRSPYGVLDLAGNVMEWTASRPAGEAFAFRITRGADYSQATPDSLIDFLAIENRRAEGERTYNLGFRCVATDDPPAPSLRRDP